MREELPSQLEKLQSGGKRVRLHPLFVAKLEALALDKPQTLSLYCVHTPVRMAFVLGHREESSEA